MYDGTKKTLHISKLRKNLISMGIMDVDGCKFVIQSGVMKVSKGILVVMKEIRIENLYKLEGSSEVIQVAVVSEFASIPNLL